MQMTIKRSRGGLLPLLAVVCLMAGLPVRAGSGLGADPGLQADEVFRQLELLAETMLYVKKFYYEEKTYQQLVHGALEGMLKSLDPYSAFMDAEAYQSLQDDTAGSYGGIGIHVSIRGGELVIIAPVEDSPGFEAGLQPGDRIQAIDGDLVSGITMRDAVERLRGDVGTTVVLEILSRGQMESRVVEIVRQRIAVSSVKGTRVEGEKVGYIRVTQFTLPTAELLRREIEGLIKDGITALVLDLRNNPGGLLDSAVDTASLFLPRGATVVVVQGREGVYERQELKANAPVRFTDLKLAVLINRGSASASEIVAGALQDHRRAILVGQPTFGKGSVQRVMPSRQEEGAAIRLTAAHYYTPLERLIHNVGVTPDIDVPVGSEEWRRVQERRSHIEHPDLYDEDERQSLRDVTDRQLVRAVDVLKGILVFEERVR